MFEYILWAIIIIVLIVIIYRFFCNDRSKRKKSEKSIQNSAGIFDDNAKSAITELVKIDEPTPGDYFRRGNIIQHNMLENDIDGAVENNDQHEALKNVFKDYTDAIITIRGHVFDFETVQNDDRDLNPVFIIDQINEFGRTVNNIPQNNLDEWHDDDLILAMMEFNNVATEIPTVRKEITESRLQKAVEKSETRREAIDNYLDSSVIYTNDNQNVHDSKVNSDLKKTLQKLKSTYIQGSSQKSIGEAQDYIRRVYSKDHTPEKVNSAIDILSKMSTGEYISTFKDTEDRIFSYVWERCKLSQNMEKQDLMRESIINALADSIHNGTQVCINGRCSRVLNSLALLDFDKDVASGAMTFEAYKNQIFQETKNIVNQEIDSAINSANPDLQKVGLAYESGDDSGLPDVEKQFKNAIKIAIDQNLMQYVDKFTDNELQDIREQCYIIGTI